MKSVLVRCFFAAVAVGSTFGQPRYAVVRLTPPVSQTMTVDDMNDFGDIAGVDLDRGWNLAEVYRWRRGKDIEWLGIFCNWSSYAYINNRGDVAGTYWYDLSGNGILHGFIYTDVEGFVDIGTLGGEDTHVFGFNNLRQVTGYSDTSENPIPDEPDMAFRYTPGVGMEPLGVLPGGEGSSGRAINDLGWVAGCSSTTNCLGPYSDEREVHTFRYTDSGMADLGALPGRGDSHPTAMNNQGVIVGFSGGGFTPRRPFIAYGNTMVELPNLGGDLTEASDVNDYNVVVGSDITSTPVGEPDIYRAFIWTEKEGIQDLNALIDPGAHVSLWGAGRINNHGQIIAAGNRGIVLLNPIPPRLTVELSSTNLALKWAPAWPGIVLEATDDLAAASWQPVPTGGTNVLVVPVEGRQRFFRLNLEGIRGLCCPPEALAEP